jgi:hypothetical protein
LVQFVASYWRKFYPCVRFFSFGLRWKLRGGGGLEQILFLERVLNYDVLFKCRMAL